ncbi:MAG: hypothetical protein KDD64_03475 [Bdellovibrionales bacterium]|nr:hypothetical protein [Bdellovibrionales bacterium]
MDQPLKTNTTIEDLVAWYLGDSKMCLGLKEGVALHILNFRSLVFLPGPPRSVEERSDSELASFEVDRESFFALLKHEVTPLELYETKRLALRGDPSSLQSFCELFAP